MINLAGQAEECLTEIPRELEQAGIPCYNYIPKEGFRSEVPYRHFGHLAGWFFKRFWYYWVVKRHDHITLPFKYSVPLDEAHGKVVRADGDCACRGVLFWYPPERGHTGAAAYHVDTHEGLKALADAIKLWNAEVATEAHLAYPPKDLEMFGRIGLDI